MVRKSKYKSEQLSFDHKITIDYDEIYSRKELNLMVSESLNIEPTNKKEVIYKDYCIIPINVTYLGHPHDLYKKRIQVGKNIKKIINEYNELYKIIILGVYNYKGLTIFVDFDYESYKNTSFNNSSFHVYINDLYMGLKNKFFTKIDKNKNKITTVHNIYFKKYLDTKNKSKLEEDSLIKIFNNFNLSFKFNEWIYIFESLPYMYNNGGQFRQTEWQGFFLENQFHLFITENQLEEVVKYTGLSNKKLDDYDFDLYFPKERFYGDLKASDINAKDVLGNDLETFINCINKHGKIWYIIYEHDTILDKNMNLDQYKVTGILNNKYLIKEDSENYLGTLYRTNFISEKDDKDNNNPLSYKNRLKFGVKFKNMKILEFNLVNYRNKVKIFNQGKQPTGEKRNPKIKLNKKDLNNDNLVIYRYDGERNYNEKI